MPDSGFPGEISVTGLDRVISCYPDLDGALSRA